MSQNQGWRIDRHIPVALIVTLVLGLLGNIVATTYWGAGVNFRLDLLESASHSRENRLQVLERDVPVIREQIQNIDKTTNRIEKKLDQLSLNFHREESGIDDYLMGLTLKELGEVVCTKVA